MFSRLKEKEICFKLFFAAVENLLMPFHHFAQFQFKLSGVTQKLLVKKTGLFFHLKMHFKRNKTIKHVGIVYTRSL